VENAYYLIVTTDAQRRTVTINGTSAQSSQCYVWISQFSLPEFTRSRIIDADVKAYVFENDDIQYDIILGREVLHAKEH